jgi:hypothetical protein
MRKTILVAALLLGLAVLPALAQEEEERPAKFSFQGRVGMLFTGGAPFENGAAFEIGMMMRLTGPFHLNISGGTSNFNGGTEVMPLTTEFADFWEEFLTVYDVYDIERSTYRINFFNFGGAVKFGAGRIEPYAVGGVGIYYVRFSFPFSYAMKGLPPEAATFTNVTDSEYFYGGNFGGGMNFKINDLIGFGGQVTYHYINSDVLENQLMTTFGLNVTIP